MRSQQAKSSTSSSVAHSAPLDAVVALLKPQGTEVIFCESGTRNPLVTFANKAGHQAEVQGYCPNPAKLTEPWLYGDDIEVLIAMTFAGSDAERIAAWARLAQQPPPPQHSSAT